MSGQGSRDAYADLVNFTTQISDLSARASLTAAPEDRGAFRRLQARLNRHGALGGPPAGVLQPNVAPAGRGPGSPTGPRHRPLTAAPVRGEGCSSAPTGGPLHDTGPPVMRVQDHRCVLLWLQGADARHHPIPHSQQTLSRPNQAARDVTTRHDTNPGRQLTSSGRGAPFRRQEPSRNADSEGRRLRHEQHPNRRTHWYLDTPAPAVESSTRRSA